MRFHDACHRTVHTIIPFTQAVLHQFLFEVGSIRQICLPNALRILLHTQFSGGTAGTVINSSSYAITAGTWTASPFTIVSNPLCVSLWTDSLHNAADATQWDFRHLTVQIDILSPVPPNKLNFLRGGTQWINKIGLNPGVATYNDLQWSFRDNGATRGDAQGTIPVISFTGGNWTGNVLLEVTAVLNK